MNTDTIKCLDVCEVFSGSIQGEGLQIGQVQTFLRLNRCNRKCKNCDSAYTYNNKNQNLIPIDEIIKQIKEVEFTKNLFITGGEPLLQWENLELLLEKLRKEEYCITIQTNGTLLEYAKLDYNLVNFMSIDYKTRCTGKKVPELIPELVAFCEKFGARKTQIKFVCSSKADLNDAVDVIEAFMLKKIFPTYIIQPMNETIQDKISVNSTINLLEKLKELIQIFIKEYSYFLKKNDIRFLPQLHVLMWGNKRKV